MTFKNYNFLNLIINIKTSYLMAVVMFEGRKYQRVYSCEPRLSVVLMQINFLNKKLHKRKRFKIPKVSEITDPFEKELVTCINKWKKERLYGT